MKFWHSILFIEMFATRAKNNNNNKAHAIVPASSVTPPPPPHPQAIPSQFVVSGFDCVGPGAVWAAC